MRAIIVAVLLAFACVFAVSSAHAQPGRWSGNQGNTYGWQLMTPEERAEHQTKLRGLTEYSACKDYVDSHRNRMDERAKEKGLTLPATRRNNPCDRMKARGFLK